MGDSAPIIISAAIAIRSQFEAIDKTAKLQRDINTVDKFVSFYKKPEQRTFAHNISNKVINFLFTTLLADTNRAEYAPLRIRNQNNSGALTLSSGHKSVTWVEAPQTLKYSKAGSKTYTSAAKSATSSSSSSQSNNSGRVTLISEPGPANKPYGPTRIQKNKRILVTYKKIHLLQQPEPFALRRALCDSIEGINLATVPLITATRTGWAIHPANNTVHNILLSQRTRK